MKTLEPKRYVVRPSRGFVLPGKTIIVQIRCKPITADQISGFDINKQKFMIQALVVGDDNDNNDDQALIDQVRLCTLVFERV